MLKTRKFIVRFFLLSLLSGFCLFAVSSRFADRAQAVPLCIMCVDDGTACEGSWDKSKRKCNFDSIGKCYSSRVCSKGGTSYNDHNVDE